MLIPMGLSQTRGLRRLLQNRLVPGLLLALSGALSVGSAAASGASLDSALVEHAALEALGMAREIEHSLGASSECAEPGSLPLFCVDPFRAICDPSARETTDWPARVARDATATPSAQHVRARVHPRRSEKGDAQARVAKWLVGENQVIQGLSEDSAFLARYRLARQKLESEVATRFKQSGFRLQTLFERIRERQIRRLESAGESGRTLLLRNVRLADFEDPQETTDVAYLRSRCGERLDQFNAFLLRSPGTVVLCPALLARYLGTANTLEEFELQISFIILHELGHGFDTVALSDSYRRMDRCARDRYWREYQRNFPTEEKDVAWKKISSEVAAEYIALDAFLDLLSQPGRTRAERLSALRRTFAPLCAIPPGVSHLSSEFRIGMILGHHRAARAMMGCPGRRSELSCEHETDLRSRVSAGGSGRDKRELPPSMR